MNSKFNGYFSNLFILGVDKRIISIPHQRSHLMLGKNSLGPFSTFGEGQLITS